MSVEKGVAPIVGIKRSIIVAADVESLDDLGLLAEAMQGVPEIGAFKLGFTLAMQDLEEAVWIVKDALGENFPIIYDHQKAANDIPDTGAKFARVLKKCGVDNAILFPFTGPATQEAWTNACLNEDVQVITGGIMTHPKFLLSEGGYIADTAVEAIYKKACELGVRHFVVPGNKLEWVKRIKSLLDGLLGEDNFVFYAPGFITQNGDISECGQAAGKRWHAIVGSAIYKRPQNERKAAAQELAKQLMG